MAGRPFQLITDFSLGYRAREESTKLSPNTLVYPSKNVVTNTAGRVQKVPGYSLDGESSTSPDNGIQGWFDFTNRNGARRNLRSGFLSGTGTPGSGYLLGSEIATNGTFTGSAAGWTLGAGWAYSANNILHTAGNILAATQPISFTVGETYVITATIGGTTGDITLGVYDSIGNYSGSLFVAGVGASTAIITVSTPTSALGVAVVPSVDFDGTIDDISVKQVTGTSGLVQFRYKDRSVIPNTVSWQTLLTNLDNARFSFTEFWDTTELMKLCLFVNGDGNVYEWNGAVGMIESSTVNTIVLSGTTTAQQQGFYTTRNKTVVVNGTEYTYTGVSGNTLTGVTTDPTGEALGSVVYQKVVTNAISAMAPAAFQSFKPDVIQKGVANVIYYGQSDLGNYGSNLVFVSKVDNFKDCTYTSPTRVVGEGYLYVLDAPARAFIPQETGSLETSNMFISAGDDWIYREVRTLDSTLTKEQLALKPLRTGQRQAVFDNNAVSRNKNGICYLANDNVINQLGQISNQYVPELTDLSYSIVDDMSSYDFSGGHTYYRRNFIYRSVPSMGIIRIYNMTNPNNHYWEAPVQYPISGFYSTEDDEIGGHGYGSSESYLLFTGHRFRENPDDDGFAIPAYAFFAPFPHGTHAPGQRSMRQNRAATKMTEEVFVDGYMSSNTALTVGLNLDLDGCTRTKMSVIDGSNGDITCPVSEAGSLGSAPFGTEVLGDGLVAPTRPPYFQVFKTFDKDQYRFEQIFFYDEGIDTQWEIISFGSDSMPTAEIDTDVRQ